MSAEAESLCECGESASANGRECGACYRGRLVSVGRTSDPGKKRRWYSRLEQYRAVRSEGSQPRGTKTRDIEEAKRASDAMGEAFRADTARELVSP